ncbi:hypothetical protein DYB32_006808 [Aphanomyces invadans]|uniref:Protein kinase domain-containing protein n=1 Tax=Aphanomyces invadans TaxID=157072 RepID=A0A418AYI8_9STRA|nr:hypothetical protein DYB32_006808 [Aphanomyces invadans]
MSRWIDRADYVVRFQELAAKQGSDATPAVLPPPPQAMVDRLKDDFQLDWDDLPPLAHEALLWDSGYILATDATSTSMDAWVQVRLPCDSSRHMQDIAIAASTFPGATQQCASASGSYLRSSDSTVADAKALAAIARCGVFVKKGIGIATSTASVYSQDALADSVVPEPRLFLHGAVHAIHTIPDASIEAPAGTCPGDGGMIIPCRSIASENDPTFCFPLQSSAMVTWLKEIQRAPRRSRPVTSPRPTTMTPATTSVTNPFSSSPMPSLPTAASPTGESSPNLLWYLGGGGGGLVLLVLLLIGLRYRTKRSRQLEWDRAQFHQTTRRGGSMPSPLPEELLSYTKTKPRTAYDLVLSPHEALHPPHRIESPNYSIAQDFADNGTTSTGASVADDSDSDPMQRLLHLPPALHLAIEALEWDVLLDRTSAAEIYYGQFQQYHAIALKILQVEAAQDRATVALFVQEVVCLATFRHASLVPFVGFGYDDVTKSACSLVAVTEYCPQGSLRTFLGANPYLDWSLKVSMALSAAQGLQYLHARNVVHRNWTAQAVWIDWPAAKVSPLHIDSSTASTTGVHVAPELQRQAEIASTASDVYAFGAMLCEMDAQMPLKEKPSLTQTCPDEVVAIVRHCMEPSRRKRPTIAQVIDALVATRANLDGDCSGFI